MFGQTRIFSVLICPRLRMRFHKLQASFRFHLAMDTLAVQLCASSLPTRTRDSHPLEPAHGGQTAKNKTGFLLSYITSGSVD